MDRLGSPMMRRSRLALAIAVMGLVGFPAIALAETSDGSGGTEAARTAAVTALAETPSPTPTPTPSSRSVAGGSSSDTSSSDNSSTDNSTSGSSDSGTSTGSTDDDAATPSASASPEQQDPDSTEPQVDGSSDPSEEPSAEPTPTPQAAARAVAPLAVATGDLATTLLLDPPASAPYSDLVDVSATLTGAVPVEPTPTDTPTDGPTEGPTDGPTEGPTEGPTDGPTEGPVLASEGQVPLVGETVSFTLGSATATAVTDESGVASTSLQNLLPQGGYTPTADYAGSTTYAPSSSASEFSSSLESCVLQYSGATEGVANSPISISADLADATPDDSSADRSGVPVHVVLAQGDSSRTVELLTDESGNASGELTDLGEGLWSISVTSDATDNYDACTAGSGSLQMAPETDEPPAQPTEPARVIESTGPLRSVSTGSDLSCAVNHVEDESGEFFDDRACGTFVSIDDVLYGPQVPAGLSNTVPYRFLSSVGPTGSGTAADPYVIVTRVALGETGVTLVQTDSYVLGEDTYRTDITLENSSGAHRVKLYRAGDCFLQDSDRGYGRTGSTGGVGCVSINNPNTPDERPGQRLQEFVPITAGSNYYEDHYSSVWDAIGSQQDFNNRCLCNGEPAVDNGMGLSWAFTLAGEGTQTFSHLLRFSPLGLTPVVLGLAADAPTIAPGGADGYTLSVSNPGADAARLSSLSLDLPAGFTFVPGSATGDLSGATVAGQRISFTGLNLAPDDELTEHVGVLGSSVPGTYTAGADAVSLNSQPVSAVSGVAPITVVAGQPNPDPDPDPVPDPDPGPGPLPDPDPGPVLPPIEGGGPGTTPDPGIPAVPPVVTPPADNPPAITPLGASLPPSDPAVAIPPASTVVPEPAPTPAQQTVPVAIPPGPPAPPAGVITLSLARPDSFPGGSAVINGSGCPAGSPVQLRTGDIALGSTTAGPDGSFSSSVLLPSRLSAGRITVTATCGGQEASSVLDLVLTTSSGSSAGASAVTAAAAVAFFVLFGLLLSQGRQTPEVRRPV